MNSRSALRLLTWALVSLLTWCNGIGLAQMVQTDILTDLAIQGPGWFVLRDPFTGEMFATRSGGFQIDWEGCLVSDLGMRLQGYADAALSVMGDLRVEKPASTPEFSIKSFEFAPDGRFSVILGDDSSWLAGQVLLQNFSAPYQLAREGHNLYSWSEATGPLAQPGQPATNGLGSVLSGWLEVTPEPVRLSLLPNAATTGMLTEGVLTLTGMPIDIGIHGSGFFLVRDPNTSERYATRAGLFLIDADNYLITYDRLRVQGYYDTNLSQIGDIQIGVKGMPAAASSIRVMNFACLSNGKLLVTSNDGTTYPCGQILLATFAHPELLAATNHGLYAGVDLAQPQLSVSPGLRQGRLELINVPADLLDLRRSLSFFCQGALANDPIATHLALNGPGFFLLRDAVDNSSYATRAGAFKFDENGYLVNSANLRVQGYNTTNLDVIGDLKIDLIGDPPTSPDFYINSEGKLHVVLPGGTDLVRGQILLQDFRESFVLRKKDATLLTNLQAAVPLPQPQPPGTSGLGDVMAGRLEEPYAMPELIPPSRDGLRLRITGEPNRQWTIQTTADLQQWDTLGILTNGLDEVEFTDTNSSHYPHRFYRVLVTSP